VIEAPEIKHAEGDQQKQREQDGKFDQFLPTLLGWVSAGAGQGLLPSMYAGSIC
jgi:hypothetical protein